MDMYKIWPLHKDLDVGNQFFYNNNPIHFTSTIETCLEMSS